MKKNILFSLFGIFSIPLMTFAQVKETTTAGEVSTSQKEKEEPKQDSRFSLIAGLGASSLLNKIYLDPVVDKVSNNVIIEKSDKMRYTASIGLFNFVDVVEIHKFYQFC